MPASGSNAIAIALFAIYLSVNLGALLLAAQSQRQPGPRKYLNSTAVTLSEVCGAQLVRHTALSSLARTLTRSPE